MCPAPHQGSPSPAFDADDCAKLDRANKEERKKFQNKMNNKKRRGKITKKDQGALDLSKRGGMTYSSGKSTCGGPSIMTQTSNKISNASINSAADYGGKVGQYTGLNKSARKSTNPRYYKSKKKEAAVLCNGSYVHPGGGYGGHAEAKIINNLSNRAGPNGMSGCQILLNIDWRKNVGSKVQQSGMPCDHCFAMLCHAAKPAPDGCDIKILICDEEGNQKEFPKEKCDKKSGYQELCKAVDGGIKPGR